MSQRCSERDAARLEAMETERKLRAALAQINFHRNDLVIFRWFRFTGLLEMRDVERTTSKRIAKFKNLQEYHRNLSAGMRGKYKFVMGILATLAQRDSALLASCATTALHAVPRSKQGGIKQALEALSTIEQLQVPEENTTRSKLVVRPSTGRYTAKSSGGASNWFGSATPLGDSDSESPEKPDKQEKHGEEQHELSSIGSISAYDEDDGSPQSFLQEIGATEAWKMPSSEESPEPVKFSSERTTLGTKAKSFSARSSTEVRSTPAQQPERQKKRSPHRLRKVKTRKSEQLQKAATCNVSILAPARTDQQLFKATNNSHYDVSDDSGKDAKIEALERRVRELEQQLHTSPQYMQEMSDKHHMQSFDSLSSGLSENLFYSTSQSDFPSRSSVGVTKDSSRRNEVLAATAVPTESTSFTKTPAGATRDSSRRNEAPAVTAVPTQSTSSTSSSVKNRSSLTNHLKNGRGARGPVRETHTGDNMSPEYRPSLNVRKEGLLQESPEVDQVANDTQENLLGRSKDWSTTPSKADMEKSTAVSKSKRRLRETNAPSLDSERGAHYQSELPPKPEQIPMPSCTARSPETKITSGRMSHASERSTASVDQPLQPCSTVGGVTNDDASTVRAKWDHREYQLEKQEAVARHGTAVASHETEDSCMHSQVDTPTSGSLDVAPSYPSDVEGTEGAACLQTSTLPASRRDASRSGASHRSPDGASLSESDEPTWSTCALPDGANESLERYPEESTFGARYASTVKRSGPHNAAALQTRQRTAGPTSETRGGVSTEHNEHSTALSNVAENNVLEMAFAEYKLHQPSENNNTQNVPTEQDTGEKRSGSTQGRSPMKRSRTFFDPKGSPGKQRDALNRRATQKRRFSFPTSVSDYSVDENPLHAPGTEPTPSKELNVAAEEGTNSWRLHWIRTVQNASHFLDHTVGQVGWNRRRSISGSTATIPIQGLLSGDRLVSRGNIREPNSLRRRYTIDETQTRREWLKRMRESLESVAPLSPLTGIRAAPRNHTDAEDSRHQPIVYERSRLGSADTTASRVTSRDIHFSELESSPPKQSRTRKR
eukprot:gb/GECG01002804.1/.p1 GENE.gb/GECG01002804.1/~~gb/GECG01002804.1/.p1  ORF type:complete len:1062 (+),score=119.60 gb/GECG01002804.1/:1-3186(+)